MCAGGLGCGARTQCLLTEHSRGVSRSGCGPAWPPAGWRGRAGAGTYHILPQERRLPCRRVQTGLRSWGLCLPAVASEGRVAGSPRPGAAVGGRTPRPRPPRSGPLQHSPPATEPAATCRGGGGTAGSLDGTSGPGCGGEPGRTAATPCSWWRALPSLSLRQGSARVPYCPPTETPPRGQAPVRGGLGLGTADTSARPAAACSRAFPEPSLHRGSLSGWGCWGGLLLHSPTRAATGRPAASVSGVHPSPARGCRPCAWLSACL